MAEMTIEELAGFICGNVKRKQVLDVLDKNGSETFEALRKITRMPNIQLKQALKDMGEKGAIIKQGDSYALTENGKKAAKMSPKQLAKASGNRFDSHIPREI